MQLTKYEYYTCLFIVLIKKLVRSFYIDRVIKNILFFRFKFFSKLTDFSGNGQFWKKWICKEVREFYNSMWLNRKECLFETGSLKHWHFKNKELDSFLKNGNGMHTGKKSLWHCYSQWDIVRYMKKWNSHFWKQINLVYRGNCSFLRKTLFSKEKFVEN